MKDIVSTLSKQRWSTLQLLPKIPMRSRGPMANTDYVIRPNKDGCLAVADMVTVKLGCLGYNEQFMVVHIERRRTIRIQRVRDG